jgi:hypothetical protein
VRFEDDLHCIISSCPAILILLSTLPGLIEAILIFLSTLPGLIEARTCWSVPVHRLSESLTLTHVCCITQADLQRDGSASTGSNIRPRRIQWSDDRHLRPRVDKTQRFVHASTEGHKWKVRSEQASNLRQFKMTAGACDQTCLMCGRGTMPLTSRCHPAVN